MHKKLKKTIYAFLIMTCILGLFKSVYAEVDPVAIVGNGPDYSGVSTLYTLGNTILGILQFISGGIAVIALLILAIKFMYSSPDERAEVKKRLIPFIIGGILVFGAVSLVKLVAVYVKDIMP